MKGTHKLEVCFEESPEIRIEAVTLQRRPEAAAPEKKRGFWARLLM